jgi:glutamate--cysteine ligase
MIGLQERWEIDRNLEKVAHRGRDPELRLMRGGQGISVKDWGEKLLDQLWPLCEALDEAVTDRPHCVALEAQIAKIRDPNLTPSAVMLAEMRDRGEGFYEIANRLSRSHARYFRSRELAAGTRHQLEEGVGQSIELQRQIDSQNEVDFDRFLADYFAQKYFPGHCGFRRFSRARPGDDERRREWPRRCAREPSKNREAASRAISIVERQL